jgi:hypothetical protein
MLHWLLRVNMRGVARGVQPLLGTLRLRWPLAARDARFHAFLLRLRH